METEKEKETKGKIPDEFEKIINDLINDLKTTFPEYNPFILKWWKDASFFNSIEDEMERTTAIEKSRKDSVAFIFKFCLKKFPPRFFDILYQNNDMFGDESDADTEFLPHIHFKNLMQFDISDKTRETIWKYLQLIMFSIIGSVENKDAFGDTANLFSCINEDEFKSKLEGTLNEMQGLFEQQQKPDTESEPMNMPNAEDIHGHISGMLDGKLGQLAKEIAEETASDMNIDVNNMSSVKDIFASLFKNPGKMMGMVKNVSEKLDSKIKSGDIKESELIEEASNLVKKMKDMPGMGNIQEMLGKMGMGGGGNGKMNFGAMESQLNRNMKTAQMKERMKQKVETKNANASASTNANTTTNASTTTNTTTNASTKPIVTDAELIKLFSDGGKGKKGKKGKKEKK